MTSQGASLVFCLESAIRGHHVYKCVWTPMVGEELPVDIKEDRVALDFLFLHVLSLLCSRVLTTAWFTYFSMYLVGILCMGFKYW